MSLLGYGATIWRASERRIDMRAIMKTRVAAGLLVATCAGCASAPEMSTASAAERAFDPAYGDGDSETLPTPAQDLIFIDKGEGEPVIFFMPTFDYRYWQFQLDEFAETHRAVALSYGFEAPSGPSPDAPSFGAPRAEGRGVPGPLAAPLVPALEALREELGVERVHLVSHSIGGRFALEVAAAWPDLFGSLTLLEPAGGVASADTPPPQAGCGLEGLSPVEHQLCVFTNTMSGSGYYEALPEPVRRYLLDTETMVVESLPPSPNGQVVPSQTDPVLLFPPICEEIGGLSMPILFVRGAETSAFGQSGLDHYQRCLPPHETAVIEGVTHNAHLDAPDAFNAAVMDFIGRHSM